MPKYQCTNCNQPFPDVNAFFAHREDCRLAYKKKPRYTVAEDKPAAPERPTTIIKEADVPNRFEPKVRNALFSQIALREGEWCLHCGYWPARDGPAGMDRELELDHGDNNPHNWQPGNLHILCSKCNTELRQYPVDTKLEILKADSVKNVYVCEERKLISSTELLHKMVDATKATPETQINSICEDKFRRWALDMVDKHGVMSREDLVNGGAEYSGCSIVTTEKYLKKMVSITGPLEMRKIDLNQVVITRRQINAHI